MMSPASEFQKRLWTLASHDPDDRSYQIPFVFRTRHAICRDRISAAIRRAVGEFPDLLTTFHSDQGQVRRLIPALDTVEPQLFRPQDICCEMSLSLKKFTERLAAVPMNLREGPLFSYGLFRPDTSDSAIVLIVHHILADAPSLAMFVRRLEKFYREGEVKKADGNNSEGENFSDFIREEQRYLVSPEYCDDEIFWRHQFTQGIETCGLVDYQYQKSTDSDQGTYKEFEIPIPIIEKLIAVSRSIRCSPYMILLASSFLLLSRYSGKTRFPVGVPVSGRLDERWKSVFGPLLNFIPLCLSLDSKQTFSEFCVSVRSALLSSMEHSRFPVEEVFKQYYAQTGDGGNLFDISISMQSEWRDESRAGLGWAEREYVSAGNPKFPFALSFQNRQEIWTFAIEYKSDQFSPSWIIDWSKRYINLLDIALSNPDQLCASIGICSAEDVATLKRSAGSYQARTAFRSLPEILSRSFHNNRDRVAVSTATCEGTEDILTYRQLDVLADSVSNQLAKKLGSLPAIVGVAMQPSSSMVAVLLGILRSGNSYLPLDPGFPQDRLRYMLEDAQCCLVIVDDSTQISGVSSSIKFLSYRLLLDDQSTLTAPRAIDPQDLAYIIYTSGSTGFPKGTRISHGALSNFIESMASVPGMGPQEILYSLTTLSFDISILEIFLPLSVGAQLIMVDADLRSDPALLRAALEQLPSGIIQATPSRFSMMLDSGWKGDATAQRILVGGEELTSALAFKLLANCRELWNMYGPTETTVWSLCGKIESGEAPISIGKPIAQTIVVIVDIEGNLCPPGIAGEILIGGAGVAEGYHGNCAMTREKFIYLSSISPDLRFYRTGDLGYFGREGTFYTLGRIDSQMKIRGHRIEAGEIEYHLLESGLVKSASVKAVSSEGGEMVLCAYVVPVDNNSNLTRLLRDSLRRTLPSYMIPRHIIPLDSLPLTPNLKVDKKRLPLPQFEKVDASSPCEKGSIKNQLHALLGEYLQREEIGENENLIHLGLYSLLSMKFCAELQRRYQIRVTISMIIQFPTLRELAAVIENSASKRDVDSSTQFETNGGPLSSAQMRYLANNLKYGESSQFNISRQIVVKGEFSPEYFKLAFQALIKRHDILRMVVDVARSTQIVNKDANALQYIQHVDMTGEDHSLELLEEYARNQIMQPFDLSAGPLMRVSLIELSRKDWYIIFIFHHIVLDGHSLSLLFAELFDNYSTLACSGVLPRREAAASFIQYAQKEREFVASKMVSSAVVEYSALFPRCAGEFISRFEHQRSVSGKIQELPIPERFLRELRNHLNQQKIGLSDLIFAAFSLSLARKLCAVDLIVHRTDMNRIDPQFTEVIGPVYNLLAIPVRFGGSQGVADALVDIIDQARRVAPYSFVPTQLLWDTLLFPKKLCFPEYCPIVFNHSIVDSSDSPINSLDIKVSSIARGTAKFALCLTAVEQEDFVSLRFEHRVDSFSDSDVVDIYEDLIQFLELFMAGQDSEKMVMFPHVI